MKLHIIGPGVVGLATGRGFERFGHQVVYTNRTDNHAVAADLHLICTPEHAVPEVVQELAEKLMMGEVVIRSSVLPGTTETLAKEYPQLRLFHNPEFLRQAIAESDFLHAGRAIIGWGSSGSYRCTSLEEVYKPMDIPVHRCPSRVSEIVKLVTNAYLAMNVSFWNELLGMFEALDVNGHTVARLVALDPRVSHYGAYQFGKPYGGSCLPKDVQQLLDLKERPSLSPWPMPVLEAVQKVNRALGGS